MSANCLIPNCNRTTRDHEPFCREHRQHKRRSDTQKAALQALADEYQAYQTKGDVA